MNWKEKSLRPYSEKDGWTDEINSSGPRILAITGDIHSQIVNIEVTYSDGSKVNYTRKED